MKTTSVVAMAALGLAVLLGSATVAGAGVDPNPFTPEINQLGAVENGLSSCLDRINKVLQPPPDDSHPSPDVNGVVNRLEAIDGQINSLRNFVVSVVDAVLGIDPVPFREGVVTALEQVKVVSVNITTTVDDYLQPPPDDTHPDIISALEGVLFSSTLMNDTIDQAISDLSTGDCVPQYDIPYGDCITLPDCTWIMLEPPGVSHCCCYY